MEDMGFGLPMWHCQLMPCTIGDATYTTSSTLTQIACQSCRLQGCSALTTPHVLTI